MKKFIFTITVISVYLMGSALSTFPANCGADCLKCEGTDCKTCNGTKGFESSSSKKCTKTDIAGLADCLINDGAECLLCKEGYYAIPKTADSFAPPFKSCVATITASAGTLAAKDANCFNYITKEAATTTANANTVKCYLCKGDKQPDDSKTGEDATICKALVTAANTNGLVDKTGAIKYCNKDFHLDTTCKADTVGCGEMASGKCVMCNPFSSGVLQTTSTSVTDVKCKADAAAGSSSTSASLISMSLVALAGILNF